METKICPRCQGNGFIKVKKSVEDQTEIVEQCPLCNSQGEIKMTTERLILETKLVKELNGVIKKLNDEVDILTKQKIYLQSKLREKEGDKNDKNKTDDAGSIRQEIRI